MDKRRVNVMKITKRLVILVTSVVLALYTGGVFDELDLMATRPDLWNHVLDHYGVPFGQFCITSLYQTYLRFTVITVLVFTTKYLPTGLYLYKFLKDVYHSSRESLRIKKIELEDIVLQIAIVKTKQCVREAECAECASQLERAAAQVRAARARVRDLVAADEALRPLIERFGTSRLPNMIDHHTTCDDHHMMELLKDLAHDKNSIAERLNESIDCDPRDISMSEKSEYSSRSDAEVEKDCQIKIIKVTNVYKVAYLKHYIKQKRLRRASRQAVLKKKMEGIKKLLEDWQKALNLVMKDTYMLEGRGRDDTSGEAGDYQPRDSDTDTPIDEYNPAWDHPDLYNNFYQEPYRSPSQEDFECQEYDNYFRNSYEKIDTSVYNELGPKHEGGGRCECALLPRLLQETNSQLLAVQDLNMADDNDSKYECDGHCECALLPSLIEETSSQLLAVEDHNMADHNDSKYERDGHCECALLPRLIEETSSQLLAVEDHNMADHNDSKYERDGHCECALLPRLIEETSSQLLAVEDHNMADHNDSKYERDGHCECALLSSLIEETSSQLLAVQDLNMADHNDSNEQILAV